MADKARHAFGTLEKVDEALSAGIIDSYDILFVKNAEGKPFVGWIDKDGNKIVVDDSKELAELNAKIATKANVEEIVELSNQIAFKVDTAEVDAKINTAVTDTVASAKSYTDEQIATAVSEHLVKMYEISHKPEGTLVNFRDKEIRVMIPASTQFEFQDSGEGADTNSYYISFLAYAPDDAVNFKEDLAEIITDSTMYSFEGNDFAGIDAQGRKYSIVWLPVAKYENDTWTYYGANSTTEKYIGWYYSVEWYNADGLKVASDCIRINLSNEDCHSYIKPYYVSNMIADANAYTDAQIEAKISEVTTSYEIIEF